MTQNQNGLIVAALQEYRSVLRDVADLFRKTPSVNYPTTFLVQQHQPPYSASGELGSPIARWRVSMQSIRVAAMDEPMWSPGKIRGSFYERGTGQFVIEGDRRIVFLDWCLGPLNGHGARYAVVSAGEHVALKEEMQLWIA